MMRSRRWQGLAGLGAASIGAGVIALAWTGARTPHVPGDRGDDAAVLDVRGPVNDCGTGSTPAAASFRPTDLVLGPVALIAFYGAVHEPAASFQPLHGQDQSWKVPIVLQPATTATISVSKATARHLRFAYTERTRTVTRVRRADRQVTFRSCPASQVQGTTGWAGAFLVDGPRCRVPVSISVNGGPPDRRRISFGSVCGRRR